MYRWQNLSIRALTSCLLSCGYEANRRRETRYFGIGQAVRGHG